MEVEYSHSDTIRILAETIQDSFLLGAIYTKMNIEGVEVSTCFKEKEVCLFIKLLKKEKNNV